MFWQSIAEDVALQILLARPFNQDPSGVNFLRVALLGVVQVPGCPAVYSLQATVLVEDYVRLEASLGEYVEWNDEARLTHQLLAQLGGCEAEVNRYYAGWAKS